MEMLCRGASGDYICSAVNGVGHPAHATLTLTVTVSLLDVIQHLYMHVQQMHTHSQTHIFQVELDKGQCLPHSRGLQY